MKVGIFDKGKYDCHDRAYDTWRNILARCYYHHGNPLFIVYEDCTVCDEWMSFQNFAIWFHSQKHWQDWFVDKDIRVKGNKIYSPDTCGLVPKNINSMFCHKRHKKSGLPEGVFYAIKRDRSGNHTHTLIRAQCNNGEGKPKFLGHFSSVEDASDAYKKYKKQVIIQEANKLKNELDEVMYNALINYEV